MALEKMTALAEFLKSKNIFAPENFDYWMENGRVDYSGAKNGKGITVCYFEYDAVFSVERYAGSADLFLVLIATWLMQNDDNREKLELESPTVDVSQLDDNSVDVEVTCRFSEPITLMPDDNGEIDFNSKRWSIAPLTFFDASKVGVGDDQARPVDQPYERA